MADMITAIRPATYQNLQLNAGAFLIGFSYNSITDAAGLRSALATALADDTKVLGATRGGGSFTVTQETRDPDVDGKRYPFKGGTFVDSIDAYLSGTLVELRPAMLAKIMATGDATTSGNVTTIEMRTAIASTDYIASLCWVGDLSDGGAVIIELTNALNTNGLSLTFTDKGEGTVPFEFHAHQASVSSMDKAPFKVTFINKPAVSG